MEGVGIAFNINAISCKKWRFRVGGLRGRGMGVLGIGGLRPGVAGPQGWGFRGFFQLK